MTNDMYEAMERQIAQHLIDLQGSENKQSSEDLAAEMASNVCKELSQQFSRFLSKSLFNGMRSGEVDSDQAMHFADLLKSEFKKCGAENLSASVSETTESLSKYLELIKDENMQPLIRPIMSKKTHYFVFVDDMETPIVWKGSGRFSATLREVFHNSEEFSGSNKTPRNIMDERGVIKGKVNGKKFACYTQDSFTKEFGEERVRELIKKAV